MKFRHRQPLVLATAVALLAIPLHRSSAPQPAKPLVLRVSLAAAQIAAAPPSPAATPDQKAIARYIANQYNKPFDYAAGIVRTTFEEADKHALPPGLLLGMMEKESGFNASAMSSYGATGLMQVVPRFHMARLRKNETESSFRNPRTNIRVAAGILAEYLASHKDPDKALRKYSGSARGYSRKVRSNWQQYNKVGRLSNTLPRTPA